MRIVKKNNKIKYVYIKNKISKSVSISILMYILAILLFIISILISSLYNANCPYIIGGIAMSSFMFNITSMIFSLSEIYYYNSYSKYIRNILFFQILYLIIWSFIM